MTAQQPGDARDDSTTRGLRAMAAAPRSRYGAGAQIVCDNLVKIYKVADLEVVALQGLDLLVSQGEMVALVGASGSGKSTLLNILGGLDTPSAGRAVVADFDLGNLSSAQRTEYRRRIIGFVWQQTMRNLVPYLDAQENVELPMVLNGVDRATRRRRAAELLELVNMAEHARQRPQVLAGGEQQRLAVAVGLANDPRVLLADEPTGELDTDASAQLFEVLRRMNEELGTTIVIVTHDAQVARQVRRTVAIRDGRISTETLRPSDDEGHEGEEFAVLDRAGRLQLPRGHVEALGLESRVRLRLEDDHIGVWPDRAARMPGQSAGPEPAGPEPAGPESAGPEPAELDLAEPDLAEPDQADGPPNG
jgi:ABC-type lipoprotein export system ATPase subunit